MKSRNRRIVRYKKPLNINIGIVIFTFIFLYIGINSIIYLTRDKISIYEVAKGQCESMNGITTTGFAIRDEIITTAPSSGYINYYAKEGARVSLSSILYTIDESGSVSQMLEEEAQNENTLTDENLTELKSDITQFASSYRSTKFGDVYDFKYDINSTLLECINLNALDSINANLSASGNATLLVNEASNTGVVEFYTDGYENTTIDDINKDIFKKENYKKSIIAPGSLVEVNTPIYKTITSEAWKVVFPITDDQVKQYEDTTIVNVRFPSENLTTSSFFEITTINGESYGVLSLKRYMMKFADSRYVDVQILGTTIDGLKVPKSAVVEKEFYTIPVEYLTNGGDSKQVGFNKEVLDTNGNSSILFVPCDIYCQTDSTCYVDKNTFSGNEYLIKPDSTSKYQVHDIGKLSGVYNVNTGYTTFRYVDILSEKNGYYIVKSGTKYGLQVYDQIVLNAKLVKENQEIFR